MDDGVIRLTHSRDRKLIELEAQLERMRVTAARTQAQQPAAFGRLTAVHVDRLSPETVAEIRERAGFAVDDVLTSADAKRIAEAITSFDSHLRVRFKRDGKGGVVLIIIAP